MGLLRLVFLLSVANIAKSAMAEDILDAKPWDAFPMAVLIAQQSPQVSKEEKNILARLYAGNLPSVKKIITVRADSITCFYSDRDIVFHECKLVFAGEVVHLKGRVANELFMAIRYSWIENPYSDDIYWYVKLGRLKCDIDTAKLAKRDGTGVKCIAERVPIAK